MLPVHQGYDIDSRRIQKQCENAHLSHSSSRHGFAVAQDGRSKHLLADSNTCNLSPNWLSKLRPLARQSAKTEKAPYSQAGALTVSSQTQTPQASQRNAPMCSMLLCGLDAASSYSTSNSTVSRISEARGDAVPDSLAPNSEMARLVALRFLMCFGEWVLHST